MFDRATLVASAVGSLCEIVPPAAVRLWSGYCLPLRLRRSRDAELLKQRCLQRVEVCRTCVPFRGDCHARTVHGCGRGWGAPLGRLRVCPRLPYGRG